MVYFKDFLNLDKERGLVRYDHLDLDMSLEILDPHQPGKKNTCSIIRVIQGENRVGGGGGTTLVFTTTI